MAPVPVNDDHGPGRGTEHIRPLTRRWWLPTVTEGQRSVSRQPVLNDLSDHDLRMTRPWTLCLLLSPTRERLRPQPDWGTVWPNPPPASSGTTEPTASEMLLQKGHQFVKLGARHGDCWLVRIRIADGQSTGEHLSRLRSDDFADGIAVFGPRDLSAAIESFSTQ